MMSDEKTAEGPFSNERGRLPVSREALYDLVWSEPMLKVAASFGVSSSYMARVCSMLNVPRPDRGYWAKLAVGKAPKQPPLPEARPGDLLEWARGVELPRRARVLPKPPVSTPGGKRPRRIRATGRHSLLRDVRSHFESGRLSWNSQYYKPAKKLLVDMVVTESGLDKAIDFANQLFLALEARAHRVVIAPHSEHLKRPSVDEREKPSKGHHNSNLWSPMRCTVVYIGTVAIGLSVIEMSELAEARYENGDYVRASEYTPKRRGRAISAGWTTTRDFPSGRLRLRAYSPYWRAKWTKEWRDEGSRKLVGRIPAIVQELEAAVVELARLVEEGERQAEIERQRWAEQQAIWRREEEAKRIAKAIKDSTEQLNALIDAWGEANRVEAFFIQAEKRAQRLPDEQRKQMLERLQSARALVGSTDALERFDAWLAPEER